MTDPLREQVSAFLDDELLPGQAELLMRRLRQDGGLRRAFEAYALIGATLRREAVGRDTQGLAARVMAEVARAPLDADGGWRAGTLSRLARPAGMVAVAASVAIVALAGLRSLQQRPTAEQAPIPLVDVTEPVPALQAGAGGGSAPQIYTVPEARPASGLPAERLANYLVSHSEFATAPRQSIMSYRLVGYEPPQRTPGQSTPAPRERR